MYNTVFPLPTIPQYVPIIQTPQTPQPEVDLVKAQLSALQRLNALDSSVEEERKLTDKVPFNGCKKTEYKSRNIQTAAQAAIQMAAQATPKITNQSPFIPLNSHGNEFNQVKGSYGAIRPYARHILFTPYPTTYVRAAFLPNPGNFSRT